MYEENIETLDEKSIKHEKRFFKKEQKEKVKKKKKEKIKREKKEKVKKEKKPKEPKEKKESSKKMLSFKADWVSVTVKLGIFLFISFVVIFVVTKLRMQKDTFTNNLEKMKDVSYVYFKVPKNRPASINEEVTMTLKDMEEGSLLPELKVKKDICSKEFSYVSLNKKTDINYDLTVYLSCGGEAKKGIYEVTYTKEEDTSEKTTLYELTRNITTESSYTCPEGYTLNGHYCDKTAETTIINATPKYRVTPEKNTPARYKGSNVNYEYTEYIVKTNEEILTCPEGYNLREGKCEKEETPKYKTNTVYQCANGTPSGTKCLISVNPTYKDTESYCPRGTKLNGQCYVTKNYSVRCIHGIKDSAKNACYKTYSVFKELSDWLYDGLVTYSSKTKLKDSDTVYYEPITYHDNDKITYKKYIRKYIKKCEDDDIRDGNLCRHYDEEYEERYCSDSAYSLNKEKTECFFYEAMKTKKIKATLECPEGYTSKGSGENKTCVRYEKAIKKVEKTPYCSSNYDLTSDEKCVKRIEPTEKKESLVYECPEGYLSRGEKEKTVCYKKVSSEPYYYCTNQNATLVDNRCIIPSQTTFLKYTCPSGYTLTNDKCIEKNSKNRISATKKDSTNTTTEKIWSKTKELEGWTWTGNTKTE